MSGPGSRERASLLFLFSVLLFVSPLTGWWSALALPWYAMYIPWALVIALAALAATRDTGS